MCAKTRSSFSSDQSVDDQLLSHWFVRIIYSREDKQELNDFLNIWLYFLYIFYNSNSRIDGIYNLWKLWIWKNRILVYYQS